MAEEDSGGEGRLAEGAGGRWLPLEGRCGLPGRSVARRFLPPSAVWCRPALFMLGRLVRICFLSLYITPLSVSASRLLLALLSVVVALLRSFSPPGHWQWYCVITPMLTV